MTVWCRQVTEGEPDQSYPIAPHGPDQSDEDLLRAKADGAADKGWDVTWASPSEFSASKDRWGGVRCTRDFWIE